MAYDPPTLAELRQKVARDVRDEDLEAFNSDEVDDWINAAIAELNQIRPVEAVTQITDTADLADLDFSYIWKVEIVNITERGGSDVIPPNNDETKYANGWVLFARELRLPQRYITWLDERLAAAGDGTVRLDLYGYTLREALTADDEVAEFTFADEHLVRQYCRYRAYEALAQDRALFQQWQTQANNSDVSPTQLTNMQQVAESQWQRARSQNLLIRRPTVGW